MNEMYVATAAEGLSTAINTAASVIKGLAAAPTNEFDVEIAKINATTGMVATVVTVGGLLGFTYFTFKLMSSTVDNVDHVTVTTEENS